MVVSTTKSDIETTISKSVHEYFVMTLSVGMAVFTILVTEYKDLVVVMITLLKLSLQKYSAADISSTSTHFITHNRKETEMRLWYTNKQFRQQTCFAWPNHQHIDRVPVLTFACHRVCVCV